MQLERMIADEKDTQLLIIPTDVYQRIARDSAPGSEPCHGNQGRQVFGGDVADGAD